MKLSAPTNAVWGVATALGVVGILGHFISIPFVSAYSFWFLFAGFIILALACLLKGL
ncbi:MAG: hypothetical protein J6Y24_07125 [Bacteroidales bacterium]|nr:hypothetical protein [Bacteroidales bacterium]